MRCASLSQVCGSRQWEDFLRQVNSIRHGTWTVLARTQIVPYPDGTHYLAWRRNRSRQFPRPIARVFSLVNPQTSSCLVLVHVRQTCECRHDMKHVERLGSRRSRTGKRCRVIGQVVGTLANLTQAVSVWRVNRCRILPEIGSHNGARGKLGRRGPTYPNGQGEFRCCVALLCLGIVIRASNVWTSDNYGKMCGATKVWILPCCRGPRPGIGGYVTD
jgi:hypothetical protein